MSRFFNNDFLKIEDISQLESISSDYLEVKETKGTKEIRVDTVASKQEFNKLKCIYFNARSIVNKLSELELCISEENPDILGLTESWLKEDILDSELSFKGYTLFRKDRKDSIKTKGGGVVLYIRSSLNPVLKDEISSSNYPESIFCSIDQGG